MAGVIYTDLRPMACCGVKEITQLTYQQDPTYRVPFVDLLRKLRSEGLGNNCGAVVFTQARPDCYNYGNKFADAIVKHKLGTVVEAPAFTNPNSRNIVNAWIWVINKPALTAFLDGPKKPEPPKKARVIPEWSKE